MAKTNSTLVIGIIILAIGAAIYFGVIPGLGSAGDWSVQSDCASATSIYTYGAQQGECFQYILSNQKTLMYVVSVIESERYGPSGLTKYCQIDSSADLDLVSQCKVVKTNVGIDTKYCSSNVDCPGTICVNRMCTERTTQDCTFGENRCYSTDRYQTCLSSNKWSGIISCPSGKYCSNGLCTSSSVTPVNTINPTNPSIVPSSTSNGLTLDDQTKQLLLYALLGIGAFLIIMAVLKK